MSAPEQPTAAPLQRRFDWLLIAVFLALLLLPTLDKFFRLDRAPPFNEKRELATYPTFQGLPKIKEYLEGVDRYVSDHFGFRKQLLRWHAKWKRQWFREALASNAIIGRDGWLYTATDFTIDHYTGVRRFSPTELDAWKTVLERRRDWLAQHGIAFLFVVPPDKQDIYPEHLPNWMKKSPLPSKLDQLIEHMAMHKSVPVLDLRPTLLAARQEAPVYFMLDTHWNYRGGFIGYQNIIETLSAQLPALRPVPMDSFEIKPAERQDSDLAIVLGQEKTLREPYHVTFTPRPGLPPLKTETIIPPGKGRDQAIVRTFNSRATGKAVVLRDSFADHLIPFLGYHFAEVLYLPRHDLDAAIIEQEKPTVVIHQILERNLNVEDPFKLLAKENLGR